MNLEWSDSFLTGLEEIDEQHRQIFVQLRQLSQTFTPPINKARLLDALAALAEESRQHFACEEDCMARLSCPAAAENRNSHAQFMQAMVVLDHEVRKRRSIGPEVIEAIQQQIGDWVSVHILRVDRRLRYCLPVIAARA